MSITAPASMETLYNYVPSFGFNLIAVLAYSFVLAAHGFWFIKYQRTRWIQAHMLAFTATGIAVYTVRLSSYVYSDQPKLWLPQFILGMFSPTWLIIGMLLALSKAYKYSSDGRVAIINRPKLIPMLLVGYQAVIGLLLIISSLFTGNNRLVPTAIFSGDSGNQLLIASLANQVIILTLIQALITWTAITLRRPNTDSSSPISRCFLALMFFTVGMVWVRSIFRLVETAQGWSGMAARSETYFGLFEFAQMFGAAAVWAVVPFVKVCDRLQEDKYVDMDLAKGRTDDGDAESVISGKHAIV